MTKDKIINKLDKIFIMGRCVSDWLFLFFFVAIFAVAIAICDSEYKTKSAVENGCKNNYTTIVDGVTVTSFDINNYNLRDITVNDETKTITVDNRCNICGKHHNTADHS